VQLSCSRGQVGLNVVYYEKVIGRKSNQTTKTYWVFFITFDIKKSYLAKIRSTFEESTYLSDELLNSESDIEAEKSLNSTKSTVDMAAIT
jgi:hypothetical protein